MHHFAQLAFGLFGKNIVDGSRCF